MAAGRRRSWIAIGGATAAVAVGVCGAVALATPSGLAVTPAVTNGAPHLTWTESDATVTGFNVERQTNCTGTFDPVGPTPDTTASFDDGTLPTNGTADGTYCYHVVAHYPAPAADETSNTASVLFDTTGPAVQITNPVAGLVHGTVQIQATAPDAGSGTKTLTVEVLGLISPKAPPLAWDTNVIGTGGQAYTVRAMAVDNLGNTSTALTTVTIDNTPPAAPVVHPFESPTTGSPILMWTAVPGETYHVARTSSTGPGARDFTGSAAPGWQDPDTLPPGTYTYVVTATDPAGNPAPSAPTTVDVIAVDKTAPRSISANSPTNTVPHVTWQPPVSFLVGGWNIYRDGALLTTLNDASLGSFDDTGLAAQGPHTYAVQAVNGTQAGTLSSPVSVTFDTMAPALGPATATPNPNGSISLNWPDATDPVPGSGIASYVVRRVSGSSAPPDTSSGTAVCTLTPPANACIDGNTKNGTLYGYGVFAIDGAGNVTRSEASARASDKLAPDPVAGLRVISFDQTYVRIGWTVPGLKGANADLAGYRVLKLRPGSKAPLNPQDGTVVCSNDDPARSICTVLNLTKGKKVTFAVYAYDEVPNYSDPTLISAVPHSVDNTPPHKPTKVRLTHQGLTYKLTWVSPRDVDLSKFRVTLYDKGPAPRPSKGKAVVTGRVLHATFTLRPGQIVYVNLFALDVSGNFSRVTKLIVAPGKIVAKSKHKVAKKKAKSRKKAHKTPPKKKS